MDISPEEKALVRSLYQDGLIELRASEHPRSTGFRRLFRKLKLGRKRETIIGTYWSPYFLTTDQDILRKVALVFGRWLNETSSQADVLYFYDLHAHYLLNEIPETTHPIIPFGVPAYEGEISGKLVGIVTAYALGEKDSPTPGLDLQITIERVQKLGGVVEGVYALVGYEGYRSDVMTLASIKELHDQGILHSFVSDVLGPDIQDIQPRSYLPLVPRA